MKHLALFPLLAGVLMAEEPKVEILGQSGKLPPPPMAPMFYATAGQPLQLNLRVVAPAGTSVDLYALCRYLTQGLQAPLPKALPLAEQLRFEDSQPKLVTVTIPTPKHLKGPALLRYDLQTTSTERAHIHSYFHVRVSPPAEKAALTQSLKTALGKSGRRLALYGESPRLRQLFESYGIEFHDLGTLRPATFPKDGLTVSEDPPPPRGGKAVHGRLLLFYPAPERPLPGIYQAATPEGRVTVVTLPVWNDSPPSLLFEILCEELL